MKNWWDQYIQGSPELPRILMLKCLCSTVNKSVCSLRSWLKSLDGSCKAQGCARRTVICCNPDFIVPVPQLGWRIVQSISKCPILKGDLILDQILAQRLCHLHCIGAKSTKLLWCYTTYLIWCMIFYAKVMQHGLKDIVDISALLDI